MNCFICLSFVSFLVFRFDERLSNYSSAFEEMRNNYAEVVCLVSQVSAIEIKVFLKTIYTPNEQIDSLSSHMKKKFLSILFFKFWGFENCQFEYSLEKLTTVLFHL